MMTETIETSTSRAKVHPKGGHKSFLIRKAAVLGAGNMGSRIAAHFANAGIPVVLLDMVPETAQKEDPAQRNRLARNAVETLTKSKPAAFFEPASSRLVSIGNFEDDLEKLRDCDWIIEAVSENLTIKRTLLRKIAPFRRPDAIVTTNTSGLPITQIAEEMDAAFRQHWFGTHFFNPPRYMRLLEIIPGPGDQPCSYRSCEEFRR